MIDGGITVECLREIDALCDQYESRLIESPGSSLQEFLAIDREPARSALLCELLRIQDSYTERVEQKRQNCVPYEIIELIGGGSHGMVFKARHRETDQTVALKVPRREIENANELLKREAQKLAGLSHPQIASLLNYGTDLDGQCFLASQFIEGVSLAKRISYDPPSHDQSVELEVSLCRVLTHLHGQSLYHRDIKPSNIIQELPGLNPVLVDFGLATCGLGSVLFEGSTFIAGTPDYMSPEQARGEEADASTDVYGLAAVLYHLLTGRPPFQGKPDFVIVRLAAAESTEPPHKVAADVPHHLSDVCMKALAPDRYQRFGTAEEFASALLENPKRVRFGRRVFLGALAGGTAITAAGVGWLATRQSDLRSVQVSTSSPATLRFQRIGDTPFEASTGVDEVAVIELPPGFYLIRATFQTGEVREVFRTIAEAEPNEASSYPHRSGSLRSGLLLLPTISLRPQQFAEKFVAVNSEGMRFLCDRTEVTIDEYLRIKGYPLYSPNAYKDETGSRPITHVTFDEAMGFAEWIGKRLPLETEYEYLRDLNGSRYPWGDDWPEGATWELLDVGSHPWDVVRLDQDGNEVLGLYSNAAEWVVGTNGVVEVVRGGSYSVLQTGAYSGDIELGETRIEMDQFGFFNVNVGFRCAATLEP
ncbi:MAG: bifunctional serine/threonine-protein kinase/formylglycine-generating enzyme family protein [Planctomycetota bacterium]